MELWDRSVSRNDYQSSHEHIKKKRTAMATDAKLTVRGLQNQRVSSLSWVLSKSYRKKEMTKEKKFLQVAFLLLLAFLLLFFFLPPAVWIPTCGFLTSHRSVRLRCRLLTWDFCFGGVGGTRLIVGGQIKCVVCWVMSTPHTIWTIQCYIVLPCRLCVYPAVISWHRGRRVWWYDYKKTISSNQLLCDDIDVRRCLQYMSKKQSIL